MRGHARPHRRRGAASQRARPHAARGRRRSRATPAASWSVSADGCGAHHLAAPGILRGFDAMELRPPWTRATPSSPPTAACPSGPPGLHPARYDGPAVAEILRRDFDTTARRSSSAWTARRAHDVPAVANSCDANGVLALHGPPITRATTVSSNARTASIGSGWTPPPERHDLDTMMAALNGRWRRSTLGWSTAEESGRQAPVIDVDRNALAEDVHERAARLRRSAQLPPRPRTWRGGLPSNRRSSSEVSCGSKREAGARWFPRA